MTQLRRIARSISNKINIFIFLTKKTKQKYAGQKLKAAVAAN